MALEIKKQELFDEVVSEAIQNAIINCDTEKMAKRWERAIDRAVTEINENPYLHYDDKEKHLIVLSSSSNNLYSANGVCQCLAFLNGKMPCWHRAAARIWRLYFEAQKTPPPVEAAAAAQTVKADRSPSKIPYLKNATGAKPQTLGNIRF